MKNINDYPYPNGDAYEVANCFNDCERYGQPGYNSSLLATQAAQLMREAGWTFLTYNDYGQEVWQKPGANSTLDGSGLPDRQSYGGVMKLAFRFLSEEDAQKVAGHFQTDVHTIERLGDNHRYWTYEVTVSAEEITGTRTGSWSDGGGSAKFQAGPFVILDQWMVKFNREWATLENEN